MGRSDSAVQTRGDRAEFNEGDAMSDQRKRHGKEKPQVIIPAAFTVLDMPESYAQPQVCEGFCGGLSRSCNYAPGWGINSVDE